MRLSALLGAMVVTALLAGALNAQNYTTSTITNNYAGLDISGSGTATTYNAASFTATGATFTAGDEGVITGIALGFTFNFYGAAQTTIDINSNGLLSFGGISADTFGGSGYTLPSAGNPDHFIAPAWDDYDYDIAGTIHVETVGTAPLRQCIIQFVNANDWTSANQNSFMCVLFETTDVIEFHYDIGVPATHSGMTEFAYGAGLENSTGTTGNPTASGYVFAAAPTTGFQFTPTSNVNPVIAVERDSSTTQVAINNNDNIQVVINSLVSDLDLQFDVTDANATDPLTLAATVNPSANINGFTQAEWDAGTGTSPISTNPTSGTFDTLGTITVTLDADDGVAAGGTDQLVFTIEVLPTPLSGTYTVANGNPGGTFDYADLGDVFDDLEAAGVSGPVIIELYDDGGDFTSAASYGLGTTAAGVSAPVAGVSATNTIAITAATGESPVINGGAAPGLFGDVHGLAVIGLGNVSVVGLEVNGGTDGGIGFYNNVAVLNNVAVQQCRIHGVTAGPGILVYAAGPQSYDGVTIENNFVWDCVGSGGVFTGFTDGAIAVRRVSNTVIRHNTVLHNTGGAGSSAFNHVNAAEGGPVVDFSFNILISSTSGIPVLDTDTNVTPVAADYNVYYATGGGTFHANAGTYADLSAWQTANSIDTNSVDTDPALANTTAGSEDLHLTAASTNAEDAAVGSTATVDIDGDTRPQGAERDIGADERVTGPVAPTITSTAPTTATVGVLYTYTVTATGSPTPTITVSGLPGWLTFDGTDTISGTPAAGDVGTTGTITVTAANGTAPDATEPFSITVAANAAPTITVTENTNAVAADQTIAIALNDPVASMALSFIASDADAGDTVTFTTSVSPSANITTFTQAEWDQATAGNPTGAATPTTGTVDTAGLITVIITATDNNSAVSTFRFFILVPVPGNTAPTVSIPTGSAFTGDVVAGFTYNGTVNTALANATLQLDDVDADAIDVISETGTTPPGVTTPGTGTGIASGSPASFTGTPTAQGNFTLTYVITDNNTASVTFTVTFVIASGSTGGGGGGGDGDDSSCSTGTGTNLLVLLALLSIVGVAYRVRGSRA